MESYEMRFELSLVHPSELKLDGKNFFLSADGSMGTSLPLPYVEILRAFNVSSGNIGTLWLQQADQLKFGSGDNYHNVGYSL